MNLQNKLRNVANLLDDLIINDLNDERCIKVWLRKDCPKCIMNCFGNHDDIDQIAFVPKTLEDENLEF